MSPLVFGEQGPECWMCICPESGGNTQDPGKQRGCCMRSMSCCCLEVLSGVTVSSEKGAVQRWFTVHALWVATCSYKRVAFFSSGFLVLGRRHARWMVAASVDSRPRQLLWCTGTYHSTFICVPFCFTQKAILLVKLWQDP